MLRRTIRAVFATVLVAIWLSPALAAKHAKGTKATTGTCDAVFQIATNIAGARCISAPLGTGDS